MGTLYTFEHDSIFILILQFFNISDSSSDSIFDFHDFN